MCAFERGKTWPIKTTPLTLFTPRMRRGLEFKENGSEHE